MKYGNEIRNGYVWSYLSPILVTILLSIYLAVYSGVEGGLVSGFSALFSTLMLFGFFSLLFSGILCGLVGIPLFYFLKTINLANGFIITIVGGLVAFSYAQYDNPAMFFQSIYVVYGLASGFFFWLGSTKVNTSSNEALKQGASHGTAKKRAAP